MNVKLGVGLPLAVEGDAYHKYWRPQRVFRNSLFVMAEEFDKKYDGYAICYVHPQWNTQHWAFFWHDTVATHGVRDRLENHFNGKEFIRVPLSKRDGNA